MTGAPLEFRVANVQAAQQIEEQYVGLQVISYEELVREERNRQIASAILVGVAAGANAYSASQAGYYNSRSTVTTPSGRNYQVSTTGYSPTAAAIAQSNAAAQNEAMIASTVERGQQNLAALEGTVIKDNTLLPGEWYGGQLHLQPPAAVSSGAAKRYSIGIAVGADRHQIDIEQQAL
jgi:Tfp pilus assembly protein PilE